MKNLYHLNGTLTQIDADFVYVTDSKTDKEYKFYSNDLQNIDEGEKVDLLIAPAFSEDSVSKILTIKQTKKAKPIKMANFSTLIGHMIKTKERLKATLASSDESTDTSDINEKIDWLEKGISLFRR
ncbi:MAG: hypothetical protein IKO19_07325 [Candidatus Riflebacteria bacterium]|nr:hypothetical protein [Candidatus Riflebacteria bacterium]